MPTKIDDLIRKLPKARRAKVEQRAEELVAEELTLRELRRRLHMTQGDLASRLGKGQGNVSRLESARDLKVSTLQKVLNAMGVEVTFLVKVPGQKPFKVQNLFRNLGGVSAIKRRHA